MQGVTLHMYVVQIQKLCYKLKCSFASARKVKCKEEDY